MQTEKQTSYQRKGKQRETKALQQKHNAQQKRQQTITQQTTNQNLTCNHIRTKTKNTRPQTLTIKSYEHITVQSGNSELYYKKNNGTNDVAIACKLKIQSSY